MKTRDKTNHELINELNKLRRDYEKFTTLCESIQDAVIMIDSTGNVVFWNKTAEVCFGYKEKEVMGKNMFRLLLPEQYYDDFNNGFNRFKKTGKGPLADKSVELIGLGKDGIEFPLELSLSAVKIGGKWYAISTIRDTTRRKRAEETIVRKWQFEKTISEISSRFIGIFDIDHSINLSLADVGSLSRASRAYLFLLREDGVVMDNTHEWCNEGVTSEKDKLQNLPINMFPWWMNKLKNKKVIHIKNVSKMPRKAKNEKESLESQKIKSLLVLPLHIGGKLGGFIGFDNIKGTGEWGEEDFSILRIFSEIVGNAFERKRTDKALEQKTHDIGERVKELNCLYKICNLAEQSISLDEIYQGTVNLIPPSWQYPEITCARIIVNGKEFKTENFKETVWRQTTDIIVSGTYIGTLEVFYKQKKPESKEGPFMEEERNLINAIAKRLSRITEQKEAEKALHESEEKYRSVVEKARGIPYVIDKKGVFTYIGSQVEKYGFRRKDIQGSDFLKVVYPPDRDTTLKDFLNTMDSGIEMVTIFRVDTPKMGIRYIEECGRILRDDMGKNIGLTGILEDVTERRQAEEKLKQEAKEAHFLSLIDDLTGLYNRRGFFNLAEKQLKLARRTKKGLLGVYIDVDQLKNINDSFGHRVGSLALIETANILKQTFRSSDIIARIGGDEFVVLAIKTSKTSKKSISARFRQNLEAHNSRRSSPYNYNLSISIGISKYNPKDPCSIDELVDHADKFMYEEKKRKKRKRTVVRS